MSRLLHKLFVSGRSSSSSMMPDSSLLKSVIGADVMEERKQPTTKNYEKVVEYIAEIGG